MIVTSANSNIYNILSKIVPNPIKKANKKKTITQMMLKSSNLTQLL